MKKFFVISIVCVVGFVMAWPYASQVLQEHRNFRNTFGAAAPWFMNQEERAVLQPLVTRELSTLSAASITFKNMPCNKDDRDCADLKILFVASSERDLNKARAVARVFHFDLSLPLCGDGSYPVAGRCFDGSDPVY